MVALVATAVRHYFFFFGHVLHLFYKLYAALYEWRTGEQQTSEFSANAYLDVYLGHINTLKHIRDKRAGAFHLMMADIYAQAKYVLNLVNVYRSPDWFDVVAHLFKVNQAQVFRLLSLISMVLMAPILSMVSVL